MPCMNYDDSWRDNWHDRAKITALSEITNRVSRVACRALRALEQGTKIEDVLKDKETRDWWAAHKKADDARIAKEEKAKQKQLELTEVKKQAIAKLTDEELEAFGLRKDKKK